MTAACTRELTSSLRRMCCTWILTVVSAICRVRAMLCQEQGLSGAEIGRFLGGRTRAAVSYLVCSLQEEMGPISFRSMVTVALLSGQLTT